MTVLKYMLDTNIAIYAIKDRPAGIQARFNADVAHLAVSAVTAMELVYGAEKSARRDDNIAVLEDFLARLDVLAFDDDAAAHAGEIRAGLERRGTPIGAYDLMIGGHARSRGLVLVTNNTKEFDRIDGLRVENWV